MERFVRTISWKMGKDKAQQLARTVADSKAVVTAGDSLRTAVDRGAVLATQGYEKTGVKAVVNRAGDKLDEISGKALLEEVKMLVQRQAVFNDVLAAKLQEALDRIAELEAKASKS